MIPGLITLLLHALTAFVLTRLVVVTASRVHFCLAYYLIFTLQILIDSRILSAFDSFGMVWAWVGLETIGFTLVVAVGSLFSSCRQRIFKPLPPAREIFHPGPLAILSLRGLLGVGSVFFLMLLLKSELYLIWTFAPSNWDSNTIHLTRMAMALQEGHLEPFKSNWEALSVHPSGSVCLHGFTYLCTGRTENLLQIVNWFSYLAVMLSIYGVCRLMKLEAISSLLAGTMFGLLTICILQSISTQTDMIFSGWIGICLYFLVSFFYERDDRDLGLSAVAATLPLSIKSSGFLIFPALGVLAVYSLCIASTESWKTRRRDLGLYMLFGFLSFILLVVPHGYWQNYQRFGHPMGYDELIKTHSFKGRPVSAILEHGSLNILRYGYSFFRLDGQPLKHTKHQPELTESFLAMTQKLGIDLNDPDGLRIREWTYTESVNGGPTGQDSSWWGILGILIIWPSVLWCLIWPRTPGIVRVFAVASIVFFLTQSYSGPYDPWRGRYFIHCALFALPCVAAVFSKLRSRAALVPLAAVMLVGISSARFTADYVYRMDARQKTRLSQITLRNPAIHDPLVKYESIVPSDSKVSFAIPGDQYLFPLFGEHLSRKLYSAVGSNTDTPHHNPEADYFLFHAKLEPHQPGDIELGADLYLRDLKHPPRLAQRPE